MSYRIFLHKLQYHNYDCKLSVLVKRVYCYAELAVSSLSVTKTIAGIHCAYPWRNSQAAGLGGLVKYKDGIPAPQPANGQPSQY